MAQASADSLRVAILSDTHGYVCPNVMATVADCDMAVHAGDIGSARVLDLLLAAVGPVHAVRGNNDVPGLWASAELDVLNAVPRVAELQLPGGSLAIEHGHAHGHASPELDKLRAAHPRARAVVYGHTHKLLVDCDEDPWVLNPGAAGRIRNRGGPSCLVLHAAADCWRVEIFNFADGPIKRNGPVRVTACWAAARNFNPGIPQYRQVASK